MFSFNRPDPRGAWYGRQNLSWTFNAGDEASLGLAFGNFDMSLAISEPITITCQPTYKLEKELLSILN